MLLKFLPKAKCLIDRFLLSQTTRVERSDSRPVKNQIRLRIKTLFFFFSKSSRQGPIIKAKFIQVIISVLIQRVLGKKIKKKIRSSIYTAFSSVFP